ncbi:MAG TPA: APC family permease [Phototrophicaceae bacterium]|jgi:amino acid transporter|nr:APC family permease [Phototrophicaceae bacterium]
MSLHEVQEQVADLIIGKRLQTEDISHQTAPNFIALAVLASDALSSVAYATEEILIILNTAAIGSFVLLGFQGNQISIPIAIAIAILIAIVTISYRQTIFSNPAGGGGYRVAKENLGEELAQVTGAALLTDYILTVAVSISAGVANLISVVPALLPYRVVITVGIILFMTYVNLRGVKESSRLFSIPTYFFLVTIGITILVGFIKATTGTLGSVTDVEAIQHNTLEPITALLLLRAFSSGCAALTGIEAISNDTQLFRQPRAKNAAKTLVVMCVILITLFISITVLANAIHAVPSHDETIISQVARTIYGQEGIGYIAYIFTMIGAFSILFMAANTPFADFPQLASLASSDGFLPRQLTYRGRRLVFTWGIYTLSGGAIFLVIITGALVTNLIPLYAIGVFMGFTISQTGMARRFWRSGHVKPGEFTWGLETKIFYDPSWMLKLAVSSIGAVVTFIVMIVFIVTKFADGAWAIVLLIPTLVWVFFRIHRHYKETAARLRLNELPVFSQKPLLFDPNQHRELGIFFCDTWTKLAVQVVNAIMQRGIPLKIVHIDVDPKRTETFLKRTQEIRELNGWAEGMIDVVDEPYRDLYQSVDTYLKALREDYPGVYFHVYVGALRTRFPYNMLHMSTDRFLRDALLTSDNVSLTVKQIDLETLPLPEGFKVTFEHATDHHIEEDHSEVSTPLPHA